ncbi:S-formylglutathione hydrolase-like [Pollicipes pollicipes]|uniref:S-formylglutathione hydrolase-like n=1 Tax=Pollicipes pollicipes TaxID=41117 RepID=UPI001885296E|nr:S-formylglutathione hydrolase-like [Pollicipes pollicipes]
MALTQKTANKIFGGWQKVFSHKSAELKCEMNVGVFLPAQSEVGKCPVIYWLSGLTCTEQNFVTKAGAQRYAAEKGVILVAPDTSPRGCNIEGEDESWDFGTGAGFYVDATEGKWKENYRMFSYVTKELRQLVNENFPTNGKQSIMGHSMGGHGALICALKNPGMYSFVSAFSPICNPSQCPWGQKAFGGYLGEDRKLWHDYDATELVKDYAGPPLEILIDQGSEDGFLKDGQLLPDNLVAACAKAKVPVVYRLQPGYDHSYYFIGSFIGDHIAEHAKALQ